MVRYARIDGILVEPLGHLWAAFSPASGETALLNDQCAAILEVLEGGGGEAGEVCSILAADCHLHADNLIEVVKSSWVHLIEAGLVHEQLHDPASPR